MRSKSSDKLLFYVLWALLLWLPLPMGSNRTWAWSLMTLGVQLLSMAWVIMAMVGRVSLTPAFRRAKPALLLFLLWLAYLVLQITPVRLPWIEILSPGAPTRCSASYIN